MRPSYLIAAGLLALAGGALWFGRSDAPPHKAVRPASIGQTDAAPGGTPSVRRIAPSIASLPDQGNLVAFDRLAAPRQRSAYTWYPVALSEAHAMRAVVTGDMDVDVPDGPPVHLKYVRHVEHPDGNWTWIGRPEGAKPGIEAIITFGEKAVFGTIPYGNRPALRLTTGSGRTWMVDTDPALLAMLDNSGTRPRGPDMVLPPASRVRSRANDTSAAAGSRLHTLGAQTAPVASATATAANTVDVLLGYTSTFATRLGGQSQAVTRLTHMVTVANQAYANSQVAAEVRLVRTVQVSYPDATSNESALYALTGVDCSGSGCVEAPVPAALQPLHAARDQYGADLVALVRNFDDDTQGGCGIAWVIGGEQTTITSNDEYAGFAIVSDTNGTAGGAFPDNGYVCRDETLAHELGHNMGSSHDRTTAADTDDSNGDGNLLDPDEYGRYPYSFGHRTGGASNFYTVMAYRDGTQTPNRVFSNPQISICGPQGSQVHPCGVAGEADNARSLRDTIPIIATFRAAAVSNPSTVADFDGDGRSDLLWRNTTSGGNAIWRSANVATQQAMSAVANAAWTIVGNGDFDGDGRADVLWRNKVSGANTIWRSGNALTSQAVASVANQAWQVAAVSDFDGDGRADILWRNNSTGGNAIWRSGSASAPIAVTSVAGNAWRIVGAGDFNGDGRSDILWRNVTTGANAIWRSGNSATPQAVAPVANLAWSVAGIGDFDGDGRDDILWRNNSTGGNAIWKAANSSTPLAVAAVANLTWSIASVGDYDGNGISDVVWRNRSTGANAIWLGANASTPRSVATVASSSWVIMR